MSNTLEERVRTELSGFGVRVRELRLRQGWTLDDLARRASLSKSYVSRVEEGERQPSIAALMSLSQALGQSLSSLLDSESGEKQCTVVRANSATARGGNGLSYRVLSSQTRAASMQPLRVTIPADRDGDELYRHEGEEWLYVLSGTLVLTVGEETNQLAPGDAAHFDARLPHRLASLGAHDAEIILVACSAPKQLLSSYL